MKLFIVLLKNLTCEKYWKISISLNSIVMQRHQKRCDTRKAEHNKKHVHPVRMDAQGAQWLGQLMA